MEEYLSSRVLFQHVEGSAFNSQHLIKKRRRKKRKSSKVNLSHSANSCLANWRGRGETENHNLSEQKFSARNLTRLWP
jgi:hypothetical protein